MMQETIPDSLHELLEEQSLELDEFFAKFSAEKLRPALQTARRKLLEKLAELRKNGSDPLTITMHKRMLAEVQNALFSAGEELGAALDDGVDIASKMGFTFFVAQMDEVAKMVGIDSLGDLLDVMKIAGNSRVRQLNDARAAVTATETGLYTAEQIAGAEQALVSVFAAGGTVDDAVAVLTSEAPKGPWATAEWKAERLARTELAYALNATASASIDAAAKNFNLGKLWYEYARGPEWGEDVGIPWPGPATPLDRRVGDDSKRMHGQIVIPGSGTDFLDPGNGKRFSQAPSRPNGRETLVPFPLDNLKPNGRR